MDYNSQLVNARTTISISKAFEMQTNEVTQDQWVYVMGTNSSDYQTSGNCPGEFTTINNIPMCPNNPVELVSWDAAQAFISKLNAKADGFQYRTAATSARVRR